jgi:hypothetical protein
MSDGVVATPGTATMKSDLPMCVASAVGFPVLSRSAHPAAAVGAFGHTRESYR